MEHEGPAPVPLTSFLQLHTSTAHFKYHLNLSERPQVAGAEDLIADHPLDRIARALQIKYAELPPGWDRYLPPPPT
jgi:hypothetical protein